MKISVLMDNIKMIAMFVLAPEKAILNIALAGTATEGARKSSRAMKVWMNNVLSKGGSGMNLKIQRKKAKYYDCLGVSARNIQNHIQSRDYWENDPRWVIDDTEIIFQKHEIVIHKIIKIRIS